jgi:hypothetical protein
MKLFWKMAVILSLTSLVLGQQPAKSASESQLNKEASTKQETALVPPDSFYKLSFAIYELDDGKHINQRDYSIIGKNGSSASASVSTRVPIFSEAKQVTYINAGLEIRCSLRVEPSSKLQADCHFEISSFVLPEQAGEARNNAPGVPVLRTTNANTWAVLTPGKPTIISSIDDVNSKKRTQIEVTATRLD